MVFEIEHVFCDTVVARCSRVQDNKGYRTGCRIIYRVWRKLPNFQLQHLHEATDVDQDCREVALKLVSVEENFEAERRARQQADLSSERIVPVEHFFSRADHLAHDDWPSGVAGILVMPRADKSLQQAILSERLAGYDPLTCSL